MPKINYDSWNITYNVDLRRDRDNLSLRVPNILSRDYQTIKTKEELDRRGIEMLPCCKSCY